MHRPNSAMHVWKLCLNASHPIFSASMHAMWVRNYEIHYWHNACFAYVGPPDCVDCQSSLGESCSVCASTFYLLSNGQCSSSFPQCSTGFFHVRNANVSTTSACSRLLFSWSYSWAYFFSLLVFSMPCSPCLLLSSRFSFNLVLFLCTLSTFWNSCICQLAILEHSHKLAVRLWDPMLTAVHWVWPWFLVTFLRQQQHCLILLTSYICFWLNAWLYRDLHGNSIILLPGGYLSSSVPVLTTLFDLNSFRFFLLLFYWLFPVSCCLIFSLSLFFSSWIDVLISWPMLHLSVPNQIIASNVIILLLLSSINTF